MCQIVNSINYRLILLIIYVIRLLLYTRREYHAITRGFVLQEVFRRVEPKQRSIGQFLGEEVFKPLGVDVFVGLDEEKQKEMSIEDVKALSDKEVDPEKSVNSIAYLLGRWRKLL